MEEFKAQPNDMSIGVISLLDHNNSFLNQSFICIMSKRETGKQAMDRIRQKMLSIKITAVVKMPKSEEQEAEEEEKKKLEEEKEEEKKEEETKTNNRKKNKKQEEGKKDDDFGEAEINSSEIQAYIGSMEELVMQSFLYFK